MAGRLGQNGGGFKFSIATARIGEDALPSAAGRSIEMAWDEERTRGERLRAMAPVAAIHALLGYALVAGFDFDSVREEGSRLTLFSVRSETPPPVELRPEPVADAPEGAAAPPSRPPTPVAAPEPVVAIEVPPPVAAAPVAELGADRSAGNADITGAGAGSGGEGSGTGSGGAGSGSGSGAGRPAEQIAGRLSNADYPRVAKRARQEGTVAVRYVIDVGGQARDCRIVFSAAGPALEATTCALIEKRFRYRPALDAEGRPVEAVVERSWDWFLRR